ncbi:hypothetical protein GmHk_14G041654 [Glycine max]|nr:hypothetical protein GmHk_14G041654 [Glycine max]
MRKGEPENRVTRGIARYSRLRHIEIEWPLLALSVFCFVYNSVSGFWSLPSTLRLWIPYTSPRSFHSLIGHVVWGFCSIPLVVVVSFCFSLVDKFLLGFAFPPLLSLTVRRKVWFNSVVRLVVRRKVWFSSGVRLVVRTKEFDREKLRVSDYKVMARVADKIKLIVGSREALKLSVRITDLWFIGIPGKTEQAEMVVVDSDGDEMHVVCKQDQLKSRKADLKENLTYVMHNFKVIKNDGKFRVCDHEYKLCFTGVTVVRQCDMEQLPFRKFRFVAFSSVIASHFKIGLLVDVIGVVDEVVFRYVSSKNTRVVLNLKDLRPIVILLTPARIKEAQGSYPTSVSNSFKASKLMINDLVLEIQEFRESLLDLGIEVRSILTPIGQGSSQEFVCVTVAKITTIVMDNYSWCYPACGQCYKKDDMLTVPLTCPCVKENDQPVLRYRVEVMVNHKGEQTKFLIWDRECAQLIGQSADEVNRLKIDVIDGDVDLNASPQALDRLLGCFLAFKVKVQPRFRNSVVLKYSDESELINVVLDMIPDSEQYVSVTGDHDPLLRIPLTPTKRTISGYSDLGDQAMQCRHYNAKMCQHVGIQPEIVSTLSQMLDEYNVHAKSFRMARDRLADTQVDNVKLRLTATREKDSRTYNLPNVSEVAALIVGDFDPDSRRDIIVETQNGELQRIHELHSSYLGLQYPLLFPYGEDGYRPDILPLCTPSSRKRKRNHLMMREWFAYRLQFRSNEAQTLLHSRKLFQQFIVEAYMMVESERLSYIRNNKKKLRVDKYCSLQTSLDVGSSKSSSKGKRVILPSTFVGSPRYMDQLYFDGMAICSHVGFSNLFITLTCNPNWPEIHKVFAPLNLKPTDRPDLISRVFRLKSLRDYPTMPYPEGGNPASCLENSLILSELNYNNDEARSEFENLFLSMAGKTYIWITLASSLRAKNQIVIMVASSGIASLLLPGGRTARSKFKIPVPILKTQHAIYFKEVS